MTPKTTTSSLLPIVRDVEDNDAWMPDKHRKDWIPPDQLPGSLREAISAFVLACAARRARGQVNEHNSMLVHVTRFQDVQNRVAEQIGDQLRLLRDRIRYGDRNARIPVEEELRALWERDFVPTSAWFPADQVILGQLARAVGPGASRRREDPGPDRQRHLPRRAAVLRAPP